jgi:putative endonuclease
MAFSVYILASRRNGTLYVGVTSELVRRVGEHRTGAVPGFTKQYAVKQLVYFEQHDDPVAAITREKQIKEWKRAWKLALIEKQNRRWRDLYDEICK